MYILFGRLWFRVGRPLFASSSRLSPPRCSSRQESAMQTSNPARAACPSTETHAGSAVRQSVILSAKSTIRQIGSLHRLPRINGQCGTKNKEKGERKESFLFFLCLIAGFCRRMRCPCLAAAALPAAIRPNEDAYGPMGSSCVGRQMDYALRLRIWVWARLCLGNGADCHWRFYREGLRACEK